jgi:membrane fusion protein (multidrug efflux system)
MASKAIYPIVAVVGIAAVSGAAWWFQKGSSPSAPPAGGAPQAAAGAGPASAPAPGSGGPVVVEAARVSVMRLSDDAQTVGSLRSRQSVMVRPEVGGRVTQLNFRDGDRVRKGQLLVQFDDQLQQAQLQQSKAELSIAQANHKRNQDLVAQSFISQRSVDESAANLEVAQAKLALAQATAARLKIIAPFDGITGIRSVNIGDYLKDGADIVNIEDMDAVYVDFRLPERFQSKVRRGQRALLNIDALPGRSFTAVVQAIDPLLDANGRSVGIRGCVDNRQLQLRPGMFARVTAVFGERNDARVIPEEALVPQGNRQFVVKIVDGADGSRTTQRVEVKVGIRRPGRVEITEGVQEGDWIVTAGQQRVQRDGTKVRVVDLNANQAPGQSPEGGAPAARGSAPVAPNGAAPAAPSLASAPVAAVSPAAARAAASGPNPCLIGMAAADRADPPAAPSGGKPAGPRPAARNPA